MSPSSWRSSAPSGCSAARTPTCSRTAGLRQPRGVPGAVAAGRYHPRHVARRRRPSQPRRAAERLGQVVRGDRVTACAGTTSGSTSTRSRSWPRSYRPKLIIAGGSAYPRVLDFARFRGDRRCGRRLSDGRHSAHRWPGRRRRASEPVPARSRGHQHHAQDAARAARRADPGRRPGARQEARTRRCSRACRAGR